MGASGTPLLSVTQTRDGVRSCRVAILERGGVAQLLHGYGSDQKQTMEES